MTAMEIAGGGPTEAADEAAGGGLPCGGGSAVGGGTDGQAFPPPDPAEEAARWRLAIFFLIFGMSCKFYYTLF